jgi:hypothetical protein
VHRKSGAAARTSFLPGGSSSWGLLCVFLALPIDNSPLRVLPWEEPQKGGRALGSQVRLTLSKLPRDWGCPVTALTSKWGTRDLSDP